MGMDIEEYMSLLSSLAAQHSPPHERHNSRPSASKYILLALAAGIRQFLFGYDPGNYCKHGHCWDSIRRSIGRPDEQCSQKKVFDLDVRLDVPDPIADLDQHQLAPMPRSSTRPLQPVLAYRYHCWYSSYRPCWKKAIGTLVSLSGLIVALWLFSAAFYLTSFTSPDISWAPNLEMLGMVSPAFPKLENRTLFPYPATCLGCLQADCGFCAASNDELRLGSCLTNNVGSASYCSDNMCSWFSHVSMAGFHW
ncbi:unnamed protein product [Sphagnum balticum]